MVYRKYFMNPSIVKASYAHYYAKTMIDALQYGEDQRDEMRIKVPVLVLYSEGALVVGTISRGFGKKWLEARGR